MKVRRLSKSQAKGWKYTTPSQFADKIEKQFRDETYHIENDYLYSLDVRRFNIVPDNYIADAGRYVDEEQKRGLV
jgi:hypothetical protein